ncbi:hypothetical protein F511_20829 [Dorcoceras hygrometricum]|uniref:Uncharacterized protein n=1 Tax=Dorcoceras hygrometricum TaxID=472368 RepID=A0A2Z7ADE8_9LAMI|nr:hypothetical protein F511_20829 [Dorcoceras hygrometricum]
MRKLLLTNLLAVAIISTVGESIDSRYPRSKKLSRCADGAGTKKISRKLSAVEWMRKLLNQQRASTSSWHLELRYATHQIPAKTRCLFRPPNRFLLPARHLKFCENDGVSLLARGNSRKPSGTHLNVQIPHKAESPKSLTPKINADFTVKNSEFSGRMQTSPTRFLQMNSDSTRRFFFTTEMIFSTYINPDSSSLQLLQSSHLALDPDSSSFLWRSILLLSSNLFQIPYSLYVSDPADKNRTLLRTIARQRRANLLKRRSIGVPLTKAKRRALPPQLEQIPRTHVCQQPSTEPLTDVDI